MGDGERDRDDPGTGDGTAVEAVAEGEPDASGPEAGAAAADPEEATPERPAEVGGRRGPEPTRFGDWEKGGRCIDF